MPHTSYRDTIGNVTWRTGVAAMLALQLLAALVPEKKVYMLQEILVVMLLTAITVAAIWLFLVAFVLFQEGVRRGVLWMRSGIAQIALLSHRRVSPSDRIVPPPLQR